MWAASSPSDREQVASRPVVSPPRRSVNSSACVRSQCGGRETRRGDSRGPSFERRHRERAAEPRVGPGSTAAPHNRDSATPIVGTPSQSPLCAASPMPRGCADPWPSNSTRSGTRSSFPHAERTTGPCGTTATPERRERRLLRRACDRPKVRELGDDDCRADCVSDHAEIDAGDRAHLSAVPRQVETLAELEWQSR